MAPIVELLHAPRFRGKMLALDYDWTLARPRGYGTFARNAEDWRWFRVGVPATLRAWYDKGYFIAIFTNQTRAYKREQVLKVLGDLGIPMAVCIAADKADHKPETALWTALGERWPTKAWKLANSVFVGDALGRRGDWSDSDRVFAERVGFGKIVAPEDFFPADPEPATADTVDAAAQDTVLRPVAAEATEAAPIAAAPVVPAVAEQEIVVFVGFPGSGKSTIAERSFGTGAAPDVAARYTVLHGDVLKTPAKTRKAVAAALAAGKSPVVDATHPSVEKRAVYIAMAREKGVPVRCVHVAADLETAYERNKARAEAQRVPRIAYAVYKKHFVAPTEAEGCSVVTV